MTEKNVVFDIGAVLVEWDPHLAWADDLGKDGAHDFMNRVDFDGKNARADGGETFLQLSEEIEAPKDRDLFRTYVGRFKHTVQQKVEGTWELLHRLKARDIPVHAITNWSAETWPEGVGVHPELETAFETLVVSGSEGVTKPDRRIYDIFLERAGVSADSCVFIDDRKDNIAGAKSVGMDGIHFSNAALLETELRKRSLL